MGGLGDADSLATTKSRETFCKQLSALIAIFYLYNDILCFSLIPSPLKIIKGLPFTSWSSANNPLKPTKIR